MVCFCVCVCVCELNSCSVQVLYSLLATRHSNTHTCANLSVGQPQSQSNGNLGSSYSALHMQCTLCTHTISCYVRSSRSTPAKYVHVDASTGVGVCCCPAQCIKKWNDCRLHVYSNVDCGYVMMSTVQYALRLFIGCYWICWSPIDWRHDFTLTWVIAHVYFVIAVELVWPFIQHTLYVVRCRFWNMNYFLHLHSIQTKHHHVSAFIKYDLVHRNWVKDKYLDDFTEQQFHAVVQRQLFGFII